MAQETENCRTAKELLAHVNAELAWFSAKKLPDLQKELDDFVKAQDGLVSDYRSKFHDLRKKWVARQNEVDDLCRLIRCEFPLKEEKWRKLVEECICEPLHRLCCLRHRIWKRRRCCAGPLEHKVDEAQAAFDKAQNHLAWMKTLADSLDKTIAANSKLNTDIRAAMTGDQPTWAIYLFYKLRRSHVYMAPFDASAECKQVCSEFDPNNLCCEIFKKPCHDPDCECVPKGGEGEHEHERKHEPCAHLEDDDAPWLLSPDHYKHELDCAWHNYHEAKEALAHAQAELKKKPDDLQSLKDKLKADTDSLDDSIKVCLTKYKKTPDDCCKEHEHEPKKGGC